MTYTYDLVDEPWIPCRMHDGSMAHLGLREAFARSHELHEIYDPSPVVTGGLHRLMLAILHRNLGPADLNAWKVLWARGCWDMDQLDRYLETWRHCLNLFHEDRPFYQDAAFEASSLTPVNKLSMELAAGNNAMLFDHSRDDLPNPISPSKAARLVTAMQTFAVVGGRGYSNGPIGKGGLVLIKGDNLFQTLSLNLVPYPNKRVPIMGDDLPTWELDDTECWGKKRNVNGYLDLLTWQSRAIRLIPEVDDGELVIRSLHFGPGVAIKDEGIHDPMVAFKASKKSGMLAVRINKDREIWRDSTSLIRLKADESEPPLQIDHVSKAIVKGVLSGNERYNIDVFGLCNDKAKIELWRHTRMPLPLDYLKDPLLVDHISRALVHMEAIGSVLWRSSRILAENVLRRDQNDRPDRKEVDALVDSLALTGRYWSQLELPFFDLVGRLPSIPDSGDREGTLRNEVAAWIDEVPRKIAARLFDRACEDLSQKSRMMKAAVTSRREFWRMLNTELKKQR